MGLTLGRIPNELDRADFQRYYDEHGPLRELKPDLSILFDGLCDDAGKITKEQLFALQKASDVYLSHEWGFDEEGRSNHDRVKMISQALREAGYITWLDEEKESAFTAVVDGGPKQLIKDGIMNCQVFVMFVTRRYIELVTQSDELGLENFTKLEFDTAVSCLREAEREVDASKRKARYFRCIIPIVLEKSMKNIEEWGSAVNNAIGSRLRLDMSMLQPPLPEIYTSVEGSLNAKYAAKPKNKKMSGRELMGLAIKENLAQCVEFIGGATGKTLLQGGPFHRHKSYASETTAGLHYTWLRQKCDFTQKKSTFYSNVFAKHHIESTVKLYKILSLANGKQLFKEKYGYVDESDLDVLERELSKDLRYNIDGHILDTIHISMAEDRRKEDEEFADMRAERKRDREWVTQFYEDAAMRAAEVESRLAWDTMYRNGLSNEIAVEKAARHKLALEMDAEFRENEIMAKEYLLSSAMRDMEWKRQADLYSISLNKSPHTALSMAQDIASRIQEMLLKSVPGESADKKYLLKGKNKKNSSDSESDSDSDSSSDTDTNSESTSQRKKKKKKTVIIKHKTNTMGGPKTYLSVSEPKDTDWYNLLEESVYIMIMIARLCEDDKQTTNLLGELGVAKYIIQCLHMECSKINNVFTVKVKKKRKVARATALGAIDSVTDSDEDEEEKGENDDNASEVDAASLYSSSESSQSTSYQTTTASFTQSLSLNAGDSIMSLQSSEMLAGNVQTFVKSQSPPLSDFAKRNKILFGHNKKKSKNIEELFTNIAQAGLSCLRLLSNSSTTDEMSGAINMKTLNERNIYLLGQANAIELVMDIMKMHLESVKVQSLMKKKFEKLTLLNVGGAIGGVRDYASNEIVKSNLQAKKRQQQQKFQNMSEEEVTKRIIFTCLECLYVMATLDYTHPNRSKLESVNALEWVLLSCQYLTGEVKIFKWACTLLSLLYSSRIASGKSNGKLCRILTEQLIKYVKDVGICDYGMSTLSFVSFVSTRAEKALSESIVNPSSNKKGEKGQEVVSRSLHTKSTREYLNEVGALNLCIKSIMMHYDAGHHTLLAVTSSLRALGTLLHANFEGKLHFLRMTHMVAVLFETGDFSHNTEMTLIESLMTKAKKYYLAAGKQVKKHKEMQRNLDALFKEKYKITGEFQVKAVVNENLEAYLTELFYVLGNAMDIIRIGDVGWLKMVHQEYDFEHQHPQAWFRALKGQDYPQSMYRMSTQLSNQDQKNSQKGNGQQHGEKEDDNGPKFNEDEFKSLDAQLMKYLRENPDKKIKWDAVEKERNSTEFSKMDEEIEAYRKKKEAEKLGIGFPQQLVTPPAINTGFLPTNDQNNQIVLQPNQLNTSNIGSLSLEEEYHRRVSLNSLSHSVSFAFNKNSDVVYHIDDPSTLLLMTDSQRSLQSNSIVSLEDSLEESNLSIGSLNPLDSMHLNTGLSPAIKPAKKKMSGSPFALTIDTMNNNVDDTQQAIGTTAIDEYNEKGEKRTQAEKDADLIFSLIDEDDEDVYGRDPRNRSPKKSNFSSILKEPETLSGQVNGKKEEERDSRDNSKRTPSHGTPMAPRGRSPGKKVTINDESPSNNDPQSESLDGSRQTEDSLEKETPSGKKSGKKKKKKSKSPKRSPSPKKRSKSPSHKKSPSAPGSRKSKSPKSRSGSPKKSKSPSDRNKKKDVRDLYIDPATGEMMYVKKKTPSPKKAASPTMNSPFNLSSKPSSPSHVKSPSGGVIWSDAHGDEEEKQKERKEREEAYVKKKAEEDAKAKAVAEAKANLRKNLQLKINLSDEDREMYLSLTEVDPQADPVNGPKLDPATALLLPLNQDAQDRLRKEYQKREVEKAKQDLKNIVAQDQFDRYGGKLIEHLDGKPLNALEEVMYQPDFRVYKKENFYQPNRFYEMNPNEICVRLILENYDPTRIININHMLQAYKTKELQLISALKKQYKINESVALFTIDTALRLSKLPRVYDTSFGLNYDCKMLLTNDSGSAMMNKNTNKDKNTTLNAKEFAVAKFESYNDTTKEKREEGIEEVKTEQNTVKYHRNRRAIGDAKNKKKDVLHDKQHGSEAALQLYYSLNLYLIDMNIFEMIGNSLHTAHYDADMSSTALPLLSRVLYAAAMSKDNLTLSRYVARRGLEELILTLKANPKRCDVFVWVCQCVVHVSMSPFDYSLGAIARLIGSGFCDIFMDTWIYLSNPNHCKCGRSDVGEEYITDHTINNHEICAALCFFKGCEVLNALCYNKSSNSRLNSTHVAVNEGIAITDVELQRARVVDTVGAKAKQLMSFKAHSFLGNLNLFFIRSMLHVLEEINKAPLPPDASKQNKNMHIKNSNQYAEIDLNLGVLTAGMALLLQASNHMKNENNRESNGGRPTSRRVQSPPLRTIQENEEALRRTYEAFNMDPSKLNSEA